VISPEDERKVANYIGSFLGVRHGSQAASIQDWFLYIKHQTKCDRKLENEKKCLYNIVMITQ